MNMEIGHSSQLCGFQGTTNNNKQQQTIYLNPTTLKKKWCKYRQINPETGKEKSDILIEVSSLCLLTWLDFIRKQVFSFWVP